MTDPARERALGALYGLAVGDALGMPTQSLPRTRIVATYGPLVDRFAPGPPDHPLAAGLPAASITDDTEQALLLAQLLVDGAGTIDAREWARRLLAWEDRMRAVGSLDLLGPSTRRALDELAAGADPTLTGRFGDTNGAAMRVAPIGIATPTQDLDRLVEQVVSASAITHNTGLALAGAAAVAAVISAAIDGADLAAATGLAVRAAHLGAARGRWVAGADVAARIEWAVTLVSGRHVDTAIRLIDTLVGTSLRAQESVPAAFAVIHAAGGDPWLACRIGASVGGDCDTIAAMAGAMSAAVTGRAGLPAAATAAVRAANPGVAADLEPLCDGLLALRDRA